MSWKNDVKNIKFPLEVAVGVIYNSQQQVLVAQRDAKSHLAGMWEFPGGKIEVGESIYQALCRELAEEIGICVSSATPITQISHQYEQTLVLLHVWRIENYSGEAQGREGQLIKWVDAIELSELPLPPANKKLINFL